MLHFSSASHNAFQPPPHRGRGIFSWSDAEHRLLSFANGTGGGTGTPPSEPNDPNQPPEPNQPSEANEAPPERSDRSDRASSEANIRTQTRTEAQQTLEGEPDQPEGQVNAQVSVLDGVEALKKKLLTTQQKAQGVYQTYKDIMPSSMQNQVLKTTAFLSMQLNHVERWIESIHTIQAFRSGNVSPTKLTEWLTTYIQNTGEQGPEQERWKTTVSSLNQRLSSRTARNPLTDLALNKMDGGDRWQTQNASTQTEIDQEIQAILKETEEIIPLDDLLALIDTNRRTLEDQVIQDGLKKMDEALKGMEDSLEKAKKEQNTPQQKKGFLDSIGIKFYSALEIWEALKMLKEAYTENFRQRTRLKAAGLAQAAGNVLQVLPYGKGIQEVLESQNDKANNDIKDGYVSFLKNGYTSFNALFGPGGELDRNRHDINRGRAVLEYAASRGWLWDINDSSSDERVVAGEKLDNFLPSHWSQQRRAQYFMFLYGQNASGGTKEQQDGKNLVATAEDIQVIIPEIIKQMQGRNFWAVLGMAEAAMGKGKLGEVSPWVAATIFNEMRKGDTMKYVPKDVMDQFGKLGLGHPGFTLQTFKTERRSWYDWRAKRQAGLDIPPQEINNFTRAFALAEQDFADAPEEQRMRLIAKILAGQVVEYKGRHFSIFDPKYHFYRSAMLRKTYEGDFEVQKADPDFFGEPSEVILYDAKAITTLLNVSNEKFTNGPQSANFLRHIIDRYDQLMAAGLRDAATQYQKDMQDKFHAYLEEGPINDVRTTVTVKQKVKTLANPGGEPAFAAMVRRNLIKKEKVVELITAKVAGKPVSKGIDTFKILLSQVDPDHPVLREPQRRGGDGEVPAS